VSPGAGVSGSRRKHTKSRRRSLAPGENAAGNWGNGSVVWFICSVCQCRIAVYAAGRDGVTSSVAELVLARYGEPPVCSNCTPAEAFIPL